MAPNGHAAPRHRDSRQTRVSSPQKWLDQYGDSEYQAWRSGNPTKHLSYDDWKTSKHVDGLSLYYATLQIFEESDSSDEEAELIEVKPRSRGVRGQSAREPKKKVTTNGNGIPRAAASATPSAFADSEDLTASGKRKRKARKKYLSEEIVASDGDSELEDIDAFPFTETATPTTAPVITVNGQQRKSSGRKPRKAPLSEEIVSPEDEIDDPMSIDEVVTAVVASPLPVRSVPKVPGTAQSFESPKNTILKLSNRKAPKKKVLSEETVLDEDTDDGNGPARIAAPTITAVTVPDANVNTNTNTSVNAGEDPEGNPASPDPASTSASATRRGLRTRRPAQKRPYFHDAQLFDEEDPDCVDAGQPSPDARSRRVSIASLGKSHDDDLLEASGEDATLLLKEDTDLEPTERRPKHFKGKGRAWKKEESDEDEEFTVAKKKAAKAKAKSQATAQKKRGRPRKSVLSEDIVRSESDSEAAEKADGASRDTSPARSATQAAPKKGKSKPRKSALSEEIVRDDSESAVEEKPDDQSAANTAAAEVTTPGTKTRGQLRNSDESTTPTSTTPRNGDEEDCSPNESYTPKGTPNYMKTSVASGQGAVTNETKSANGESELGSDEPVVVSSIAKYVAEIVRREESQKSASVNEELRTMEG